MIYKPKSFRIEELVPESVFRIRGERAWELLDEKLTRSLQEIRDYTGKRITANDWLWGGDRHNQVFRDLDYYDRFSVSQHLFGRAGDPYIEGMSADESRELIINMKKKNMLEYVSAMEKGENSNGVKRNWLHIDTRPTDRMDVNGLFIFQP